MKKILIISNVIFVITTLVLGYILLFTGTEMIKADSEDNRITVKYAPDLRDLVMSEMRDYLEVINEVHQGMAENNPEMIVKAATRQGKAAIAETPARLLKLSPLACKQMGFAGHDLFQAIADSARVNYNPTTTSKQLAALTNNCVTCHKVYKVDYTN
ncbi:MAG: hypothetical protein KAH10_04455 [Flavobacteriales bacterium]|nr:hypothetical protein [Flavobacteriales bacterium]